MISVDHLLRVSVSVYHSLTEEHMMVGSCHSSLALGGNNYFDHCCHMRSFDNHCSDSSSLDCSLSSWCCMYQC